MAAAAQLSVRGRGALNLVLLVAVAALGALAWFKPGAQHDADQHAVFGDVSHLQTILSKPRDAAGFALARGADGGWRLTAPFTVPADPVLVTALLDDLKDAKSDARYASGALDLKQVGLAEPGLVLTLDGHRYEFGGTEAINYRRYLRDGDAVSLVSDLLYYRVSQEAGALADKRLLPKGAAITALELPGRALRKTGDGKWQLIPDDPTVSADAIVALIDAWSQATADAVKARAEGVVQATLRVTLAGANAPLEFQLLTAAAGLRLARPDLGIEYALPAEARATLLELPKAQLPTPAPAPTPKSTPPHSKK